MNRTPDSAINTVLALQQVSKSFIDSGRAVPVLNAVELQLQAGQRIALLGPSGSGKTTLLNIAAGLETADSGAVLLNGQDLARLSERQRSLLRRRYLGFVFQSFNLFPQLSVNANIRVSLRLNRLQGEYWEQRLHELVSATGLSSLLHRMPAQLSGGEQQRVAIARALVHEPRLILADEPTGNLDQGHAAGVLEVLQRASAGRGLLLVTHSRRAAALCDRQLCLDDGRVLAGGAV